MRSILLDVAKLSAAERRRLPRSDFCFPDRAPGPRSYPIPDEEHAGDALSRSSGTEDEAHVKACVERKFPDMEVEE